MASRFASEILSFSSCNKITKHLNDSQKVFIVDLISALETFPREGKWKRAIISGAAFLFWMFGISDSDDVRHTVLGILRTKRMTRANALIVETVQSAIDATIETFGIQGKPLNVEKDTKITTSLLATWSDRQPTPIRSHPQHYEAAQLCIIYKPENFIQKSHHKDLARTSYVHLIVMIVEKKLDSSMNINDEILQEYLAKIEDDKDSETLRNTNTLEATKKIKGKLTEEERNRINSRYSDTVVVKGVSYPCGSGYRTIFESSGSFKSVARSKWLSLKKGEKEAIVIKETMAYNQYQKSVDQILGRVKLSRVKGYHMVAFVGGEWKMLTVEKFDEEQEKTLLEVIEVEDGLASLLIEK